ncbi:MAG: HD domain-containing protein [Spirochaetaceae bacterium]|nr:HD domain-containing protein [Spirochaetaceae bacterium]
MTGPEAVIEIGSTGIRLLVAQINTSSANNVAQWSVVDRSELPASLGRDVFTKGAVSRETLLQCLQILKRFREQISAWNIPNESITVFATSALREAKNRDAVLDRIMVKTGFRVRVIDGIEENLMMYIAVSDCLKKNAVDLDKNNSMILEVGGGSSAIMLINHGKMAGVHSIRLGTVIIEQQLKSMTGSLQEVRRFLEEFIRVTRGSLDTELKLANIAQFIAVGSEAQVAAQICGKDISSKLKIVERDSFLTFVDEVQDYSIEECVARFKIPYADAQALHIGLMAYKYFLSFTEAKEILVPFTNIREGIILNRMLGSEQGLWQNFYSQVTASALNLARKYKIDEKHAQYVRMISLKLFDSLQTELGLEERGRLLLEVAAILHDIGMFIRADNHEEHSMYIINHSDIFGLNRDDVSIISQVAYYHRGRHRPQDSVQYAMSSRADRILILKLTAILRLADALDRGHLQKINDFSIVFHSDSLEIKCLNSHNLVLERVAVAQKTDVFESVFGYKVILS